MEHTATVPAIARRYFGVPQANPYGQQSSVRVIATFKNTWRYDRSSRQRISVSHARRLRKDGVTAVVLSYQDREADFNIQELVR